MIHYIPDYIGWVLLIADTCIVLALIRSPCCLKYVETYCFFLKERLSWYYIAVLWLAQSVKYWWQ